MEKDERQLETLNSNYEELEDDKKDTLLSIGEELMNIQSLINNERVSAIKNGNTELKIEWNILIFNRMFFKFELD